MQIVAISPDAPEQAREMADRYGITFPLLSDPEHVLAKQYAGLSDQGYPLPSMYIVRQDGSVYLRRIGDAKDDRIYAGELLSHLDAMQGSSAEGKPAARGFEHPTHVALGLGLGGHRMQGDNSFAGDLSLAGMRSLGRYVSLGAEIGGLVLPERELRANVLLQGQLPIWAGVGELSLQVPLGYARRFSEDDLAASGVYHGVRLGLGFEVNPNLLLLTQLAFENSAYDIGGETVSSARLLFRTGVGWKF